MPTKKKRPPTVRIGQVWKLRTTFRRVEEVNNRSAFTSMRIGSAGRFSTVTERIAIVDLRREWKLWKDAPTVSV